MHQNLIGQSAHIKLRSALFPSGKIFLIFLGREVSYKMATYKTVKMQQEVVGIGSGLCSVAGFGTNSDEPLVNLVIDVFISFGTIFMNRTATNPKCWRGVVMNIYLLWVFSR
jgi:hypothetical protein